MTLKENVKAEMHQSVIELGTDICGSVDEARKQVIRLRSDLAALAEKQGLKIASAGTPPIFRTGTISSSRKVSVTGPSCRTCSRWRGPT